MTAATKPAAPAENPLQDAIDEARWHCDHARKNLIDAARRISESMDRLADGLLANPDRAVNSCGELQAEGPGFDRLCSDLWARREMVAYMEKLAARMPR